MITPLLPYLLKARCPSCRKRKLHSLDTVKQFDEKGSATYITLHQCDHCQTVFRQEKSGPLSQISQEELQKIRRQIRESELVNV